MHMHMHTHTYMRTYMRTHAHACHAIHPTGTRLLEIDLEGNAIGDDGVGGWANLPELPDVVFLVSEKWPDDIAKGLAAGFAVGPKVKGAPSLSMPAAEVFGQRAVPAAIAATIPLRACIAVGDCMPAVRSISKGNSAARQIRETLRCGSDCLPADCLAVHVRRELNTGADDLSHPHLIEEVKAKGFPVAFSVGV